jgi:hypothetical protein
MVETTHAIADTATKIDSARVKRNIRRVQVDHGLSPHVQVEAWWKTIT